MIKARLNSDIQQQEDFSVAQLQSWMQAMLVHHMPVAEGGLRTEDIVNATERLSALAHLNIYRYSYIARLRACMQNQFAALNYALGSGLFESFADQYLNTYPSNSYTLNTLGQKFPGFLQQTRPGAAELEKESWPDFMIELAQFEYTLSEMFDEKADESYCPAVWETPDELLKVIPVIRLFHTQYPICQYYLDYTRDKKPELPFPQESYCAVARRNYQLGLFNIPGAQYYFLKLMQEGLPATAARDRLLETFSFKRNDWDKIWPVWKKMFVDSGFLCVIAQS